MLFRIIFKQLKELYSTYRSLIYIKKRFPSSIIGKRVEIINPTNLHFGENVSIQDDVILHCGGADWCNNTGFISIDNQSSISPHCIFWGCGAKIIIGKNFDCAPGVKIFASRTEYESHTQYPNINSHIFADVIIGDNVICYANVVISPGVHIGNGAVVGANSVVLNDVPEHTLVAGAPAKFIRKI